MAYYNRQNFKKPDAGIETAGAVKDPQARVRILRSPMLGLKLPSSAIAVICRQNFKKPDAGIET